jgi:hypothetical protein
MKGYCLLRVLEPQTGRGNPARKGDFFLGEIRGPLFAAGARNPARKGDLFFGGNHGSLFAGYVRNTDRKGDFFLRENPGSLFAAGDRNPDRKGVYQRIVGHYLLRVLETQTRWGICWELWVMGGRNPEEKDWRGNHGHCYPRVTEIQTGWEIFAGESRVIVC